MNNKPNLKEGIMNKNKLNAIAMSIGVSLLGATVSATLATESTSKPFDLKPAVSGSTLAGSDHADHEEGSCGEKKDGSCGEGKCGEKMKKGKKEGSCGEKMKKGEKMNKKEGSGDMKMDKKVEKMDEKMKMDDKKAK